MNISEEKQLELCLLAEQIRSTTANKEETELLIALLGPPTVLQMAKSYEDLAADPHKALKISNQALKTIDKEILKRQMEHDDAIDQQMDIFEPFKTLITNLQ